MTIVGTLANRDEVEIVNLKKGAHKSLHNINSKPFYIEPLVNVIRVDNGARFVLFSAPGASGKSALAKYFAYKYKALYWDLSSIRLGDNTFIGTLLESVEDEEFQNYKSALQYGKSMMVIDALDEAVLISGSGNVENLIADLAKYTIDSSIPTILLFARTETAHRIAEYCRNKLNVSLNQYEISYIPEQNAKSFIIERIEKKKNIDLVTRCIDEQFRIIRQILPDKEACNSFLGYAPVLEAISSAYDEENNTIKLLNKLKGEGLVSGTRIIYRILNSLLEREQNKVIVALKQRWQHKYPEFDGWDSIYTKNEQIIRTIEYVCNGTFNLYENEIISGVNDIKQDYMNILEQFIPEHPFIRTIYDEKTSFAGPAFRDYVIAACLADAEYRFLAEEYCSINADSLQVPSQMVFDFYSENASTIILEGSNFNLLYESFKSKERNDIKGYVNITDDNIYYKAFFGLYDEKNNIKIEEPSPVTFDCYNIFEILSLSNTKIDINGDIKIGRNDSSVYLLNSVILCNEITFDASEVYIKSRDDLNCILISNNPVKICSHYPRFIIEEDRANKVKISFPNIKSFSSLRKHEFSLETNEGGDELIKFAMVVDKILDCMRKHKKDAPAKDIEYIEHEIVAQSLFKRKVLDCLLEVGIVYIDDVDKHLYKLNREVLSNYDIGWQMFARHGEKPFEKLYDIFRN